MGSDVKVLEGGHVVGTFPFVENFEAFSPGDAPLQSGNYFWIKLGSKYSGKDVTCQRTSGTPGTKKTERDQDWVLRLHDGTETVFKFTADGVDDLILDFAGATLKQKQD